MKIKLKRFGEFFRLLKRNLVSLHHFVWGKGWKKFVFAIILTLVLLVGLLAITLEVTSTPKFCNTCHNMKPYYASWEQSSHKHVTCTDCHFPPGLKHKLKGKFTALSMVVNYFTGVYKRNKPWAEISDESCMRGGCHERRTLTGKVDFKKDIIFDHAPHLKGLRREKKLRCTSCHSQIVQGSHISVTESTCFLCHFKGTEVHATIDECTKCHVPPVAKEGDKALVRYDHKSVLERKIDCEKCHGTMVVGDGTVPKIRCSGCHADREKIASYENTELMHKNHITDHKIECDQCHTEIQHKSVARSEFVKPDCHACHPDFHNAQLYLFVGKGGKGLPDHPSPMYLGGLNCQACHLYHLPADEFRVKGEIVRAKAESCEPCHGKGYSKILADWKAQTNRKVSQLSNVLRSARKIVEKKNTHNSYLSAIQKLNDAEFNYKLVKHGNSIHNIAFASKLLDKAYELTKDATQDIGSFQKLPYFEVESHIVPGECSNCHVGVERKTVTAFGWKYPHLSHLKKQGLSCSRCHSNERVHGQLVIEKQDCMNCHHQEDKTGKAPGCKQCHDTQHSVYFSQIPFSTVKIPNSMVSDVACLDCHKDENDKLYRPTKTVCSICHEKDYEEMFIEWENTSLELLNRLKEKVKSEGLKKGDFAYDTLMLLEKDGSRGIHNPELYEILTKEALK
jgi:nitrate/TMAO reductase-like tetraheme cytochrome c subunit